MAKAPVETTDTTVPSPVPGAEEAPPVEDDPYHLDASGIKDPPRGWG